MWNWLVGQYNDIKGNFKWACIAALWWVVVHYGRRMLQLIPNIPGWMVSSILLCLSLAVFVWLAKSAKRSAPSQQPAALQSSGIPTLSGILMQEAKITFDVRQWFRGAYYSPVTAEVEKNIKIVSAQSQPNDREGFLARFIGVGLVSYLHDMTWAYMFRSQAVMLTDMNNKGGFLPVAEAKTYYNDAVKEHSYDYRISSFDSWLEYMKREQLIIQHPSDMLEITHRGKDFLRYLTHWGRDINSRVG